MRIRPAPSVYAGRPAPHLSDEYLEYLESPAWKATRAAALDRAGHRCEQVVGVLRCRVTVGLEVHHLTYDRLGGEAWGDLIVLCRTHHLNADRRRQGARRSR